MHRVTAPGMAAKDAFHRQISTFKNTPFLYGFYSIVRTRGLVPAFVYPQKGRNQQLVGPNGEDEQLLEEGGNHGAKL